MKQHEPSLFKANMLLGLQFLSDIGDQITFALLALSILDISESTKDVGLVYFIEVFGIILFTLVGGVLGDRYNRRNILCISNIGRGLVVLTLIVAFKFESMHLIYLIAFMLSILAAIYSPVNMSAWAHYVPSTHLRKYNSLSETVKHGATIVGPIIASFFIAKGWKNFGFMFDSLTFFICAICLVRIISDSSSTFVAQNVQRPPLLSGFKIIFKHSILKRYVAHDAIQMISFGAFNATFLVLAQRDFGWSKIAYSQHLSIVAIFTFLGGGLGALNFVAKINDAKKLVLCTVISAIAYLLMLHIKTFPLSSIFVGICDGLAILTISVTRTKAQIIGTQFYPESLSSMMAARRIALSGAAMIGTLSCLFVDNFITLENSFKLFVIPLFLSVVPIMVRTKPTSLIAQSGLASQVVKL